MTLPQPTEETTSTMQADDSTWTERLVTACRALAQELFDEEGLDAVFAHVRNLLVATLVVSAGVFAVETNPHHVAGVGDASFVGYLVAGVGVLLVLLNLADGLRRLARRRHHIVLRVALITAYLFISIRLAQMLFIFRSV